MILYWVSNTLSLILACVRNKSSVCRGEEDAYHGAFSPRRELEYCTTLHAFSLHKVLPDAAFNLEHGFEVPISLPRMQDGGARNVDPREYNYPEPVDPTRRAFPMTFGGPVAQQVFNTRAGNAGHSPLRAAKSANSAVARVKEEDNLTAGNHPKPFYSPPPKDQVGQEQLLGETADSQARYVYARMTPAQLKCRRIAHKKYHPRAQTHW
ncbi:unnamed protein product [Amoebophrya sp. A120]|nr:unnamed protein product [Amoebophrya sp. A120]|eukprot:GSA120T00017337001.1